MKKRLIAWLFALTMLCSMVALMGCKPEEQPEPEQSEESTPETDDDSVVNKDNSQNDDTAKDIFD